jgi:hypothetical protein
LPRQGTGPSTSCCRCSGKGPHCTSTTSNWASAVAGGQTSGPIPAPRHLAPTPAEASRTTRPSSPPVCSRTSCSTSAIAATSSSTRSSVRGRLSLPPTRPAASAGVELDPLYVDVIVCRYQAPAVLPRSAPNITGQSLPAKFLFPGLHDGSGWTETAGTQHSVSKLSKTAWISRVRLEPESALAVPLRAIARTRALAGRSGA